MEPTPSMAELSSYINENIHVIEHTINQSPHAAREFVELFETTGLEIKIQNASTGEIIAIADLPDEHAISFALQLLKEFRQRYLLN